jgi:hypothetical protein
MLGLTTLLLLVGLWQGSRGTASLLELLVQPRAIATLPVGNAALAFFHLFATIDAFRSGLGGFVPPRRRGWEGRSAWRGCWCR